MKNIWNLVWYVLKILFVVSIVMYLLIILILDDGLIQLVQLFKQMLLITGV